MDKASSRSLNQSFSMAEVVGYLIYDSVLVWINRLQKLSLRFFPILSRNLETNIKKIANPISASSSSEEIIEREDMEMVIERMGMCLSKQVMSFDKVSTMFEEKEPQLEEVEAAFSVFDENCDGFIDTKELQRVFEKLGFAEAIDFDACRSMIDAQDQDGDGRINFEEFVRFMENGFC